MALIKCKECGEEVSSKAKTCPKCGAKVPKKTSIFTWIVLFFIIFTVYVTINAPEPSETTTLSSSQNPTNNTNTPSPKASWETTTSKNEMTGEFSAYAHSPTIHPTKQMTFPYSDVSSWIGVGCDSENEWVYFGFNSSPNITNDETKDGYNLIRTRVKWNNQVENVELTQDWGAKFIHFQNDASAISKISASKTALLELHWHGQQPTYFQYPLHGSSKAIAEMRAKCARKR